MERTETNACGEQLALPVLPSFQIWTADGQWRRKDREIRQGCEDRLDRIKGNLTGRQRKGLVSKGRSAIDPRTGKTKSYNIEYRYN